MELQNRERDCGSDVRKGLENPGMGVIRQGTEPYPAGGGIGGGQSMNILALRGLSAVAAG
jgi:hypothetical protein